MSIQTERDFIYDYLIHLDSFLLHGISDVELHRKTTNAPKLQFNSKDNKPFRNQESPLVFIIHLQINTTGPFNNNNEKELFIKMVSAMGINPESIYLLNTKEIIDNNQNITNLEEAITQYNLAQARYFICLGFEYDEQIQFVENQNYHLTNTWKPKIIAGKETSLITIPSLEEMLKEPRHKKMAWAHLKRICNLLEDNNSDK